MNRIAIVFLTLILSAAGSVRAVDFQSGFQTLEGQLLRTDDRFELAINHQQPDEQRIEIQFEDREVLWGRVGTHVVAKGEVQGGYIDGFTFVAREIVPLTQEEQTIMVVEKWWSRLRGKTRSDYYNIKEFQPISETVAKVAILRARYGQAPFALVILEVDIETRYYTTLETRDL